MKINKTHSGQYKKYDDSYYEWDIITNKPTEEVIEYCVANLIKRKDLPEKQEYRRNSMYGGIKSGDMNYYFAGYYSIREIENGYHFTYVEPYAD